MDKVYELWEQRLVCLPVFSRIYLKWVVSRLCEVQKSRKN